MQCTNLLKCRLSAMILSLMVVFTYAQGAERGAEFYE